MPRILPFALVVLLISSVVSRGAEEDILLTKDGHSTCVIYDDAHAPASVQEAAKELQRVLKIATGAPLPIVHAPGEAMIALGDTPETRQAGIESARMADEHFEIKTQGKQVFIAGRDTKDGEVTQEGGVTDGTYNGVMEFLERYVGARWLMPGGWGEDVPARPTLTLPVIAIQDGPDFASRSMTISFGGVSGPWRRHLRVAPNRQPIIRTEFNHAWDKYDMPARLKGHPEYMALVHGERTKIEDWHPEMQGMKFCTTNEGLIELYANALMEEMAKKPAQQMWSIAPSDGGGWCECEKCTALDEPCDWPGNRMYGKTSKTRRVVTFYNAVARRVKARYPDKVLGGYLYAAYTYPSVDATPIESNLFLMLASRPYYGFTLYQDELAKEAPRLIDAWDGKMKGRMGWVDYSTYVGLKTPVGAPYPPGKAILKLLFPALHQRGWQAMYWSSSFNVQGWGSLHNYLTAKLLWHADADVDALAAEWLERAYGPGGVQMGQVYDLLEQKLAAYKQANPKEYQYRAIPEQVKAIHLPLFPQMEVLYREALAKAQTDAQRRRLEMFGDNLVLLNWNMRQAGWLEKPETSAFYRSDADFKTFVEQHSASPSISTTNAKPEIYLKPQLGTGPSAPAAVDK